MKGTTGLLIAIGLGLLGAVLNFAYLSSKSADFEKVAFVAIRPNDTIRPGDTFRADQLVPVEIPREHVGLLGNTAVRWEDRGTVVGWKAVRPLTSGQILMLDDLKTPPQELKPAANECVLGIPVDTKTFVASLVMPGNEVSFLVPRAALNSPTPARSPGSSVTGSATPDPNGTDDTAESSPSGPVEIIGPFRVMSLGNRLGSADVLKAAGVPQVQENVMNIAVRVEGNRLEARAQRLVDLLMQTNFRQVGVLLHPKTGTSKQ